MDDLKNQTLVWANSQRKKLGMRPLVALPAGVRGSPKSCPVARALSNGWQAQTGSSNSTLTREQKRRFRKPAVETKYILHPRYVHQFIRAFDAGRYPELESVV